MKTLCYKMLLLTVLAYLPLSAFAVNEFCKKNELYILRTDKLKNFPAKLDYCKVEVESDIPESIKALGNQLGELNLKIAKVFGAENLKQIMPNGMGVQLLPLEESQPLQGGMSIAVPVDWNGGLINDVEYVHEMGHILSMTPNSKLVSWQWLAKNKMTFIESIADTLMIAVLGKTRYEQSQWGRPGPVLGRTTTRNDSFDQSFRLFYRTTIFRDYLTQCPGRTEPWVVETCQRYTEYLLTNASTWPLTEEELTVPFKAEMCLDKNGIMRPYNVCDPHTIGIPVNSFLYDLAETLGRKDLYQLYFRLITAVINSDFGMSHSCVYGKPGETPYAFTVKAKSHILVMQALQAQLKNDDVFEALWAKHGMDTFLMINAYNDRDEAETAYGRAYLEELFASGGDELMTEANLCWKQTGVEGSACKVKCKTIFE